MLANAGLLWRGERPLSGGSMPEGMSGDTLSGRVGCRQSARVRSCGESKAERRLSP